jgi:hypothetical protein
MSKFKKTSTARNIEVKSIEYPVIYSYIYERESQDIKRLAGKFKNTRLKKTRNVVAVKTITSFLRNAEGKIIPIYEKPIPSINKDEINKKSRKSTSRNTGDRIKKYLEKNKRKENPNKNI